MPSEVLPLLLLLPFAAFLAVLAVVLWPRPKKRAVRTRMPRSVAGELASTRTVKAAALPAGTVQLAGTVEATATTLRAPIWGAECVAYRVEVLTPRTALRKKTGHMYKTEVTVLGAAHEETAAVPFDVVDETGRVRVQADASVRLALPAAMVSSRGLLARLTPEAQRYLDSVMDTLGGPLTLRESWLPAGAKCYVVGQGVPPSGAEPPQLIQGERTILISQ